MDHTLRAYFTSSSCVEICQVKEKCRPLICIRMVFTRFTHAIPTNNCAKAFPSGLHFNRMQGAAVKSKKRISYLISLRNDSMVLPSASTRLLIERSNCENEMVKTARYHLLSCPLNPNRFLQQLF